MDGVVFVVLWIAGFGYSMLMSVTDGYRVLGIMFPEVSFTTQVIRHVSSHSHKA